MIDHTKLSNSLTSVRLPYLKELLSQLSSDQFSTQDRTILLQECLNTYDCYYDNNCRNLITKIIDVYIIKYNQAQEILNFIKPLSKVPLALTDLLILIDWNNSLIINDVIDISILNNLTYNALSTVKASKSRDERVYRSIIANIKYAISQKLTTNIIDLMIAEFNIDTVSIMVRAVIDLQPSKPQLYDYVSKKATTIIDQYNNLCKDMLPILKYSYEMFRDFIKEFITKDNIDLVFNNFDKLIMKNSEVTLGDIVPKFVRHMSKEIDITNTKTFPKILNGLKNNKEIIRTGCFDILRFIEYANYQELLNIAKTANNDSKALIYELISTIPDVNKELIIPLVAKETNDNNLRHLIRIFLKLMDIDSQQDISVINSGLANKKLNLRRLWYLEIGEYPNKELVASLNIDASPKEYLEAPLLMVNSKGIVCVFISIYLNSQYGLNNKLIDQCIDNEKLPITSIRLISKLLDPMDIRWAGKVLSLPVISNSMPDFGISWVYLLTSSNISYDLRLLALDHINSDNSLVIIDSLFSVLSIDDKVQDLKINFKAVDVVVKKLMLYDSIKLIIIANSLGSKNDWIRIAQLVNFDIKQFVSGHFMEILQLVNEVTVPHNRLYDAGIKTLGQMCFIVPELVIPQLIELFTNDFEVASTIDDISIKMWQNESELPVVNVVKVKDLNKNSKNYETEKWESELRKELKKISKEDQKLIDDQLAKEAVIKLQVQIKANNLIKDLDIINNLVSISVNFDTHIEVWYPKVISLFANVLLVRFDLIIKLTPSLTLTFLCLSGCMKLDYTFKQLCGLNILAMFQQKSWDDTVISKILFRLKFVTDQTGLDLITFSYIFPLLSQILVQGYKYLSKTTASQIAVTSEFVDEDPQEEQLILALDILANNSQLFANRLLPRIELMDILIQLMKLPSKFKIAKDCFNAIITNVSLDYDIQHIQILFDTLITPVTQIKLVILEMFDAEFTFDDLPNNFSSELWITAHDPDDRIADISKSIWVENGLQVTNNCHFKILTQFGMQLNSGLRLSVADTIIDTISQFPESLPSFLEFMIETFTVYSKPPPPKLDEFGLVIKSSLNDKDRWEMRSTIALILTKAALMYDSRDTVRVFEFLINLKALDDANDLVREELQNAGVTIIKTFNQPELLIPIFEHGLETLEENTIKESIIILYGSISQHLSPQDPRIYTLINRLFATLKTPSEAVQIAISQCLGIIIPLFDSSDIQRFFDQLFNDLFNPDFNYNIRLGSAYGIAGIVNGVGIKALTEYNIIRLLRDAADDKKCSVKRESVSLTFFTLSFNLKRYFEPYVIEILPIILKSLGDQVPEVRNATDKAAKTIMANTTSYGVKKLIPLAISNLDEIAWRSKKGSVELLGAMAYLDPAQLSSSLSIIVPEIVGVLNDTHKEVRKAADQSLKRFGEVIRNPEIQSIVGNLIQAIGDPTKYTDAALDKLIKTQFVHYIDGPSLALIIHVIHRGMKDRSAQIKRKACQIVGNMAILVDAKDLHPYLNSLITELESCMVDPVPSTRSTAARALGSLVEKLGEDQFPDLIPKLLSNLQDESKAGDRLGSAQALSEVICGLGITKLDELLPIILKNAKHPKNYIRAGFMPLLLYLPVCFGSQFATYLNQIIPAILAGLADSDEEIRDMALRAGRLIVKNYAKVAIVVLLPELEAGMNDTDYRIRLSSVELAGDLLFQVTGISGKTELSQDEADSVQVHKSLVDILGKDRRDSILALLFICRSDVNNLVRSKSIEIWKALVANTPRTIKEILNKLIEIVIKKLSSDDEIEKTISATTLGEMVKRVGSNALATLLPSMVNLLDSRDGNIKEGICIAVVELVKSSNHDSITEYQDLFLEITYKALNDSSPSVRIAAAGCFNVLQSELGKVVIDNIIPQLLNMLDLPDSENALGALTEIMSTKSDIIFPILIPTLLKPPIDNFKIKALSSLASVAGNALYKKLSLILNTFVDIVLQSKENQVDPEEHEFIKSSFDKVLFSITDQDGVNPLLQTLLSLTKDDDYRKRAIVYERLAQFFQHTSLDYSIYLNDMISSFILSLGEKSSEVVKATFEALNSLVKAQPKDVLDRLVKPAQQALMLTGVKDEELEAFKLPRGPNCILPIFLQGLMYGNNEQKELSAIGIADIISKTPGENLKPFSTTITGPLIRIIGEKVSSNVKSSILIAINNLLRKIPQFLRPFLPQLQRTFVRLLNEPSSEELRTRAITGLGILIKFQPRVDSLIVELIGGCKNSASDDIQLTMLKALLEVIDNLGTKLSENTKQSIMELIEQEIVTVKGKLSIQYAKLLGSLSQVLSQEEMESIVRTNLLSQMGDGRKFGIIGVNAFLKQNDTKLTMLIPNIINYIISCTEDKDLYTMDNAVLAIGKMLLGNLELDQSEASSLIHQLCKLIVIHSGDSPNTVRLAIIILRTVARTKYSIINTDLDLIIPVVFSTVRSPIIPIKLASEKCYLEILKLLETDDIFKNWFNQQSDPIIVDTFKLLIASRSIGDYTKRVAMRLANVEKERIQQGGDSETVFSDRIEDEQEIWLVSI